MICKACNHIRDIDLCRDSHTISDGKQVYVANSLILFIIKFYCNVICVQKFVILEIFVLIVLVMSCVTACTLAEAVIKA